MFKKVNVKVEPPKLFLELLEKESTEYQKKFHKFWKEGQYYDIYTKIIDNDPVSLAIVRITKEEYEVFIKEKSLENYLDERKLCTYMCQSPHRDWRKAIGEYEIYTTIFKNDPTSVFTKTEYVRENDIILFPKSTKAIKYRSLKEGRLYDNRMRIFESMMYTYLKSEIEN